MSFSFAPSLAQGGVLLAFAVGSYIAYNYRSVDKSWAFGTGKRSKAGIGEPGIWEEGGPTCGF